MPWWLWLLAASFLICFAGYLFFRREMKTSHYAIPKPTGATRRRPGDPIRKVPTEDLRPKPVPMVSYDEILGELRARQQRYQGRVGHYKERIKSLQTPYENMALSGVLNLAKAEEKKNLATILQIDTQSSADLGTEIRKAGSHSVATFFGESLPTYDQIVIAVAEKLQGAKPSQTDSIAELERCAIGAAMNQILAKATPEQRSAMMTELASSQGKSATGLATATGGLVLANLSGFALYTAAASSLSAVTGAIGLSLPFAAYTGMSTVLATVTGPVGWVALAAIAAFTLGGANFKKTVPGVLAVAAIRARLMAERDEQLALFRQKQNSELPALRWEAERLEVFLGDMQHQGLLSVPKDQVPW